MDSAWPGPATEAAWADEELGLEVNNASLPMAGKETGLSVRQPHETEFCQHSPSVESCGCGLGPSPVRLG